jgi:hypothetical protein
MRHVLYGTPLGVAIANRGLDQEAVEAQRALGLSGRHEEVRVVEVDRIDIGRVDEGLYVDGAGLARLDGRELLVAEDHLLEVQVVATCDLLPVDLDVPPSSSAAGRSAPRPSRGASSPAALRLIRSTTASR